MSEPKLLSIPRAAKAIGEDRETVRAWTRRAVDPLPTVLSGADGSERQHRKVVMSLVDEWLVRNSSGGVTA